MREVPIIPDNEPLFGSVPPDAAFRLATMSKAVVPAEDAPTPPGAGVPPLDPPTRLQCLLCREIFRKRAELRDRREEWASAEGTLEDDGIAELVRIAEGVTADERDRGRQLDSKSASLAGFSGLILTIDVALARSVFGLDLGDVGNVAARAGFVVAATALLLATTLAIAGVLMPQRYRGLGRDAVDDFNGPEFQTTSRSEIHRSLLQSLAFSLAQDRSVNDCKARLTKGVARALLVGFLALTVPALTLAVRSLDSPMHTSASANTKTASRAQPKPSPPPAPLETETVEKTKK